MPPEPESEFVRLLMPHASQDEIEEATRRWFAVLRVLDRIVTRRNADASDSRGPECDATLQR
jgi:hypothetical protein